MFQALPSHATVVEVGPRDGLQSEPEVVPTAVKVALIERLAAAGLRHIEITSFVNPKWVPQLADAMQVATTVARRPDCIYSALVPNMRGLESALEARVDEVVIFAAASETFSRKNTNREVAAALAAYAEVAAASLAAGKRVRAYVSTAWGCPYEGAIAPAKVCEVAQALVAMGAYQVSIGDTIGVATPAQVQSLLALLLDKLSEPQLALHFHDTRGMGMANVVAGLDMGIRTFDSSVGGLGGCPYAPGATGNIATDDLVYMLDEMGIATGVSLPTVMEASRMMMDVLGRDLPSRYFRAQLAGEARCGGA
ncbi:MAG: hydroxymethylglutaryl-CoA lyase [Candidatus Sericytochromatia bacterium]|nr:hydroxymethylglutaryl-CoA lyase [Candidatus Sericytochromatia bacterium]